MSEAAKRIKQVAHDALDQAETILAQWLPGGKVKGREYVARNPKRDDRSAGSFSVNIDSGIWSDFATDDKGGDLVSLIAFIDGCSQSSAAKRLAEFIGAPSPGTDGNAQQKKPQGKPRAATKAKNKAGAILPVPAQADPPPAAHRTLGKPTTMWAYNDAKGRLLFYVCRFDPVGKAKEIRPLSFHATGWKWKGIPPPRPIFQLDKIIAAPDLPILICEGERAACAAGHLFPASVTTTAPNGAASPGCADWSPAKGRTVRIWPDNDDPGDTYAKAVADLALRAGALSVEILDIDALSIDPKTGASIDLPAGWDAADALVAGWTDDLIQRRGESRPLFLSADSGPAVPGFELRDDGVYHMGTVFNRQTKEHEPAAPLWICSPLDVTALTRDAKGENWGRLLEFSDPDGNPKSWAMPMNMLKGSGEDLRGELLRQGLLISSGGEARRRLTDYITQARPPRHVRCVLRTGWHGGDTFVFPHRSIGPQADSVLFQADTLDGCAFSEQGTLLEWRNRVSMPCAGNSRMVFSISAAFAAVLLGPSGEDSGGFHFRGGSSSGKTTALRVAASVFGGPDFVQRWRATDNGLESLAAQHSDALLILDELSQMDPRAAGEAAYMLANGAGKSRADRNGNARARKTWRILFLSSGEIGLSDHMATAGQRAHAGQEIRMADIPADAGKGLGLFEDLHGETDGDAYSRHMTETAACHFGTAGPAFIQGIITKQTDIRALVRKERHTFMRSYMPDSAGGQVQRVANRFALVAIAGELATAYGLTGWQPGEAEDGAGRCFSDWLSARGGGTAGEEIALISQVRLFFENNAEARFTPWDRIDDSHAPRTMNRAGFVRFGSDSTIFYVLPETFRRDVVQGFDPAWAARILVSNGFIRPGEQGRPQRKERIPGFNSTQRVYVITIPGDAE